MNETYSKAIVGYTINGEPVYDYDALACIFALLNGTDEYNAAAWIDHNYIGVSGAPVIIRRTED